MADSEFPEVIRSNPFWGEYARHVGVALSGEPHGLTVGAGNDGRTTITATVPGSRLSRLVSPGDAILGTVTTSGAAKRVASSQQEAVEHFLRDNVPDSLLIIGSSLPSPTAGGAGAAAGGAGGVAGGESEDARIARGLAIEPYPKAAGAWAAFKPAATGDCLQYLGLPAGPHGLTFEAAADGGTAIASASPRSALIDGLCVGDRVLGIGRVSRGRDLSGSPPGVVEAALDLLRGEAATTVVVIGRRDGATPLVQQAESLDRPPNFIEVFVAPPVDGRLGLTLLARPDRGMYIGAVKPVSSLLQHALVGDWVSGVGTTIEEIEDTSSMGLEELKAAITAARGGGGLAFRLWRDKARAGKPPLPPGYEELVFQAEGKALGLSMVLRKEGRGMNISHLTQQSALRRKAQVGDWISGVGVSKQALNDSSAVQSAEQIEKHIKFAQSRDCLYMRVWRRVRAAAGGGGGPAEDSDEDEAAEAPSDGDGGGEAREWTVDASRGKLGLAYEARPSGRGVVVTKVNPRSVLAGKANVGDVVAAVGSSATNFRDLSTSTLKEVDEAIKAARSSGGLVFRFREQSAAEQEAEAEAARLAQAEKEAAEKKAKEEKAAKKAAAAARRAEKKAEEERQAAAAKKAEEEAAARKRAEEEAAAAAAAAQKAKADAKKAKADAKKAAAAKQAEAAQRQAAEAAADKKAKADAKKAKVDAKMAGAAAAAAAADAAKTELVEHIVEIPPGKLGLNLQTHKPGGMTVASLRPASPLLGKAAPGDIIAGIGPSRDQLQDVRQAGLATVKAAIASARKQGQGQVVMQLLRRPGVTAQPAPAPAAAAGAGTASSAEVEQLRAELVKERHARRAAETALDKSKRAAAAAAAAAKKEAVDASKALDAERAVRTKLEAQLQTVFKQRSELQTRLRESEESTAAAMQQSDAANEHARKLQRQLDALERGAGSMETDVQAARRAQAKADRRVSEAEAERDRIEAEAGRLHEAILQMADQQSSQLTEIAELRARLGE